MIASRSLFTRLPVAGRRLPINRQLSSTSKRQNATLAAESRLNWSESLQEILRKPRTIPIPRWITPRHYTITLSEVCGHCSFMLVAISYAVDDFLTLRIIAVAGSAAMLFFTYFHPHGRPLWLPFKWNVLFIGLNSYRIGKVYLDRFQAENLPDDWIDFRNRNFYLMDRTDFAKLVKAGTVEQFGEGDVVVAQGEDNDQVRLVIDGKLKVFRDDKLTYTVEEANFLSEAGLHAGLLLPGKIESCCTVVADSQARILSWRRDELVHLMHRNSGVRRSLKAILSWDIVRKLKAQRYLLASGIIDDPEEWTERRTRQNFHRYLGILDNVLKHPQYLDERRKQLDKYRMIHHIQDLDHETALKLLGWTPAEFARGYREGETPYSYWQSSDSDSWSYYVHHLWYRIFGPRQDFE